MKRVMWCINSHGGPWELKKNAVIPAFAGMTALKPEEQAR